MGTDGVTKGHARRLALSCTVYIAVPFPLKHLLVAHRLTARRLCKRTNVVPNGQN